MAQYVEDREFTLRLELRCTFADDYQGEEDGFEWTAAVTPMAQAVVAAASKALGQFPGWTVRPRNRGRAADDEVTLVVERTVQT